MKFMSVLSAVVLGFCCGYPAVAQVGIPAEETIAETPTSVSAEDGEGIQSGSEETVGEALEQPVPEEELSKGERQRLEKQQAIEKERSEETNRFKRKAIERAEEREKRQEELRKKQDEADTVFRKKALERAKERAEEKREKYDEVNNKKSRFSELAKQRAEARAEKKRQKLERVRR